MYYEARFGLLKKQSERSPGSEPMRLGCYQIRACGETGRHGQQLDGTCHRGVCGFVPVRRLDCPKRRIICDERGGRPPKSENNTEFSVLAVDAACGRFVTS